MVRRGGKASKDRSKEIAAVRRRWDKHAKRYDRWYECFKGAVEHHVDLELLKGHLPRKRGARTLDAAGGTGRITLPLAKMGYSVTLCDISPGMLDVARRKLLKARVLARVEICECDVCNLHFADESFDFVLCWDGGIEAAKELIRVTRIGGGISMFLVNKYGAAISMFRENPDSSLDLLRLRSSRVRDEEEEYIAVGVDEAKKFFKNEGVKVVGIYPVCGMLDLLSIPRRTQESRKWDRKSFHQVTEMLLRLSKEPSVKGLSRHLVLYGERIS